MSRSSHRTLVDHLRALPDETLVELLRARPDLGVPVPADLSVLATRAHSRTSVSRALDHLDQFTLEILDGLRLAAHPITRTELDALVGGAAPAADVAAAVARLGALAVLWPDGEELHLAGTVSEACAPYPAGLGRPVGVLASALGSGHLAPVLAQLGLPGAVQPHAAAILAEAFAEPARIEALVAGAPEEGRAVLTRLAAGPPVGAVRGARRPIPPGGADTPVRWLLAHGLLISIDDDNVELPREVGLVLRGDRVLGELHPAPPSVAVVARTRKDADAAGAGQALEVVRQVEALLEAVADDPPGVLRSGGIGVREMRRTCKAAGVDEAAAPLLLELARAAGLLDDTAEAEPEWLPTAAYDVWREEPVARRWARLARTWLSMARLPGLIGQRDEKDKLVAALSFDVQRTAAPELRRLALGVLADRPNQAVGVDDVNALLGWHAPRRGGRRREDAVRWALAEAAVLGVTGRGALTSFGASLLRGEDPVPRLEGLLPAPLDHVLVQADLTVVAPGPLLPELAAQIGLVADVESAGGATVYRVTPASVRRALDAGRSAGELHQLFAQRSRTPIPQALTYLIDDVARRHGGLRAGAAASYLRSDDDSLLAEILADRRCEPLRLRRLAPSVLIGPTPMGRMLDLLRSAGYAPVAEDAYGALVLTRPDARRAGVRVRPTQPGIDLPVLSADHLVEAVRAVRAGDERARAARRAPVTTTELPGGGAATAIAVLQHAARERRPVWLGYVDSHGGTLNRFVWPTSLGAGYLRADDETSEISLTIALHRITSAALTDAPTQN